LAPEKRVSPEKCPDAGARRKEATNRDHFKTTKMPAKQPGIGGVIFIQKALFPLRDFAGEAYSLVRWFAMARNLPELHKADAFGQVLEFRPRPRRSSVARLPVQSDEQDPVDQFAKYEQELEAPINYRQRALMNVIALAITALLMGAGVWLADAIEVLQKNEDCVLQGRSNCAPIEISASRQQ
jgi:hypothetical protein